MKQNTDLAEKLKLIDISQKLKKDVISYSDAKQQILDLFRAPEYKCCENISLVESKCKYPNGLPIETIDIKYCENCSRIHDVVW